MGRQTITFVLDTERDHDILSWLHSRENKSAAIREAVRARLAHDTVTLADVYQAVLDLQNRSWAPAFEAEGDGAPHGDEPPDVAAALDSLGL